MSGMIQDIEANRQVIRQAHREAHDQAEHRSLAAATKAARSGKPRTTEVRRSRLATLMIHHSGHVARSMADTTVSIGLLMMVLVPGAIA